MCGAFQSGATVSSNGSRGGRHTYLPTLVRTRHDVWKDIVQLVRAVCVSHLASFGSSWLCTWITKRHYKTQLHFRSNDALYLQRTTLALVTFIHDVYASNNNYNNNNNNNNKQCRDYRVTLSQYKCFGALFTTGFATVLGAAFMHQFLVLE